jgi:aerobic-type carbon monoxide dehydrogenase small subunit (CoxS/CutS family)
MASIQLNVNGEQFTVEVSPNTPLLWVLRDALGLTGTKYSCGIGECGACTVHLEGQAFRSCLVPVSQAADKAIVTIEALSPKGDHPLQKVWISENVPQCGYCQPGQIMTAAALLAKNPNPSDNDIGQAMSDVLCRCGTYQRIRLAIHQAAASGGAS